MRDRGLTFKLGFEIETHGRQPGRLSRLDDQVLESQQPVPATPICGRVRLR
jgi:hypothetical protein